MADNDFRSTCETLFRGMDGFISSKTVVGDAIELKDGTVILPLMDVSFGVGAGASEGKNNNGAGGIGGKMSPSALLIISQGVTKLVNVKNQDTITKIIDMVPDFINKFNSSWTSGAAGFTEEEVYEAGTADEDSFTEEAASDDLFEE